MRQFYSLLKKEFSSFFENYSAYWVVFVYLFVSIGCAFYFGEYFQMQDTALYALFYNQPIFLICLLPVLTMKIWSEEYKSGTAEVLLTQPVSDIKVVLAKISAVFVLSLIMLLLTLPFVIYTQKWLLLDWQSIVLSYVGVLLVDWFLICMGCFVSGLCNNLISSYLLSVFVAAMWLVLPFSAFYPIYNNFLFAEIGCGDVFYYVGFSVCFIFLNVLALQLRRYDGRYKFSKFAAVAFFMLMGTGALVVSCFYLLPEKYDFTNTKLYTLKEQTNKLLNHLTKPITMDVYFAKDYQNQNPLYRYYAQRVERLLMKYQAQSKGLVKINFTLVEPYSDLEKQILDSGIYYKQNAIGSYDYFGAVLRDDFGNSRLIKQFLYERIAFIEKDMDMALLYLAKPELQKNVGIFLDVKQNIDDYEGFFLSLENDYNVILVKDTTYEFSTKMDLLILVNPKKLPEHFLYAIDQYVMRGGKVIVLLDAMTKKQTDEINVREIDIAGLLQAWGINLQDSFYEKGIADVHFNPTQQKLELYKALAFQINNKNLQVQPIIKSGENLIAALVSGELKSVFKQKYDKNSALMSEMNDFVEENKEAKIAIIGDVDILDDENWIDAKSEDKNPYSIINKVANGYFIKSVVDYMSGNEIYNLLPVNKYAINQRSISELINAMVYRSYAEKLNHLDKELLQMRNDLYAQIADAPDKLQKLLSISSAGQKIAHQEKMLEQLQYQMKNDYKNIINLIILLQLLCVPMCSVGFIWIIMILRGLYKKRKIKEMFDE